MSKGISDMMKHYLATKEKYKDCVLFYRLGDFYEMFFEDAVEVSRLLELTLTGKDCGMEERAPMCGIPYHAADGYIAKLVSFGKKVAICEQISDPKTAGRNLVERDVVRIVSAGTVIEEDFLDATRNNYIACAFKTEESVALAWADITTGEFLAEEFKGKNAVEEAIGQLMKLSVAEVICNEAMLLQSKDVKEVRHGMLPAFSCYMPWAFNVKHAEKNLLEQFKSLSLAAFGIAAFENLIAAAGALVEYLRETQKHALVNINTIRVLNREKYMELDSIAVKNLELVKNNAENKKYGSLLWVLDKTKTGMGARLLNRMVLSPLHNIDEINQRLDGVEELVNASVIRVGLGESLKSIGDVERLAGKVSLGSVNARDLASLRQSLSKLPYVKNALSFCKTPLLRTLDDHIDLLEDVYALLEAAIVEDPPMLMRDGGIIREGFSPEVDECRKATVCGKDWLTELEAREREQTGIKNLKVGYNKVFGYYIDVSNSFKSLVPPHYIRKQTLANNERYITDELKKMEDTILGAEERLLRLETELFGQIREQVSAQCTRLKQTAYAIAELDALCSLAEVADRENYCRPEVVESESCEIILKESRHPVVEKMLGAGEFVPNDVTLDCKEDSLLVITGPNMAGKSTYMRQAALIVLMAQMGSFVPASYAKISVVDKLFTRVGASDDLASGRSTFMVEMSEVANILANATSRSFLILDEIGRGTSTFDGLSIAWAVLEYILKNIGARTMFATHYHELTELEGKLPGVKNYSSDVRKKGEEIVFLRKIRRGEADGSYGVCVAALAGIPKAVTLRAEELSRQLEEAGLYAKGGSKKGKKQQDIYEQDGMDLISYTASTVMQDELIEELKNLNVQELTPIEAMNILYRLHQKAEQRI